MKFLIVGADNTAITATTTYNFIHSVHTSSWSTTETNRDTPVAAAMTLSEIYVRISTAPGVGETRTFTIMKNGATTGLAVTISGTDVQGSTIGQSISYSAEDTISIEASASATVASTTSVYWTVVAESVSTHYFVLFGGNTSNVSTTVENFAPLQSGIQWGTTAQAVAEVMPLAGNITALTAMINSTPGSGGDAYTLTVLVDEAASELAVTWTDAETGIKSDTGSVAITAGQTVAIRSAPAVTPTARNFSWSVAVTPTTAGESALMFGNSDAPSTSTTEYEQMMGGGNAAWITTEANRLAIVSGGATVQAIYAKVGTAPDNGAGTQSWTFTLREDSGDTAVAVTIAEADTTGNSTEDFALTNYATYNYSCAPANTPAAMTGGAHLGIKIFFATDEGTVVKDLISFGMIAFPR